MLSTMRTVAIMVDEIEPESTTVILVCTGEQLQRLSDCCEQAKIEFTVDDLDDNLFEATIVR